MKARAKGHARKAAAHFERAFALEASDLDAARDAYRAAEHDSALLSFNIALLLEDLKRDAEAVDAYLAALVLEPTMHEAHFHLSVLHERQRRPREALKHLLAYRRLTRA
jgi:hypothetical protein